MICRKRNILILLIETVWMLKILHASSSASFRNPQSVSPISNWNPSWTASAAQGTTTALAFSLRQHQPAVLILMRTQLERDEVEYDIEENDSAKMSANACTKLDDINVTSIDPTRMTLASASKRYTCLGCSALCCMTGLSSDVDYLTRRLLWRVQQDNMVHDAQHHSPLLQWVHDLADMLRSATKWSNDRPFGVQALLIGTQPMKQPNGASRPSLSLFTLDPSGGYRYWGVATAIGKSASLVRKRLHENLVSTPSVASLESALHVSLNATMSATDETAISKSSYQALVVWNEGRRLRAATIDSKVLQRLRQSILDDKDSSAGDKALS